MNLKRKRYNFTSPPAPSASVTQACSLQCLDRVGHAVSESGDLEYPELELISLALALVLAPANLLDHACS